MAKTYTRSYETVNDGDSNVYNIEDLVGEPVSSIESAQVKWRGISETTTETVFSTNSASSSTSNVGSVVYQDYPAVPSGYTFAYHNCSAKINNDSDSGATYDGEINNAESTDSFSTFIGSNDGVTVTHDPSSNHVGEETRAGTSSGNEPMSLTLNVSTTGEKEEETTYQTEDPSISGDVSASGPTSLTDGEESAWYSLTGLVSGDNTFNFSINGSGTADFKLEVTYTSVFPEPIYGRMAFQYNGTWYEVSVADPSNTKLKYNHIQVYSDADSAWGAIDFVDPGDSYASDAIRIYDTTTGQWLAARIINTRPV